MTDTPDLPEGNLIERTREDRLKWKKHIEYILSSLGYAVGLMNVWRFPYVCYANGGAAFLIPYTIMLVLVGFPIYFMEAIIGQFPSLSPVLAFGLVPIAPGVGITQVVISFLIATYYVVILVWSMVYFYFGMSLHELPWRNCTSHWGQDEDTCYVQDLAGIQQNFEPPMCARNMDIVPNITDGNETIGCVHYQTAAVQFFEKYVLQIKDDTSFGNIGPILPSLALMLLLVWVIIFLCISRGIQTSGKVVYFTAVFPYLVLGYFCIVGFSLDGASDGLLFLFRNYEKIGDINVWQAALAQMFLSCSIGLGGVIMYASFNEFQNKLCRDAVLILALDLITSVLATIAVFSVIGFYAKYIGQTFDQTFTHGVGLMFYVLPDAVAVMPLPKIGTLLLFLMVFTLGIDSQFVLVETMVVTIEDLWPVTRRYRSTIGVVVCTAALLVGLVYVTRGGILVLQMVDTFIEITLTWSVFWEIIFVVYFYGLNRIADNVFIMDGYRIGWPMRICWAVVDPIAVFVLFIVGLVYFDALKERDGFEPWSNYVGLAMCVVVFLIVPIYAIYAIVKYARKKELSHAFKPPHDWGPHDPVYRTFHSEWKQDRHYDKNPFKQLINKQEFPDVAPLKAIH